MAVAVEIEFEGGTLEQYDKVVELMGLTPGGGTPHGALFHWVAKTDSGIKVVDVWETREEFEAFAAAEIGPKSAAAGIETQPTMTFYEVHNYFK